MKSALYILAFYTLLLACIPCQDEVFTRIDQNPVSVVDAGVDHPPHGSADLCSPFCICTCCAGMDIPVLITSLPERPTACFTKKPDSLYLSAVPSGGSSSVWQPPRV